MYIFPQYKKYTWQLTPSWQVMCFRVVFLALWIAVLTSVQMGLMVYVCLYIYALSKRQPVTLEIDESQYFYINDQGPYRLHDVRSYVFGLHFEWVSDIYNKKKNLWIDPLSLSRSDLRVLNLLSNAATQKVRC